MSTQEANAEKRRDKIRSLYVQGNMEAAIQKQEELILELNPQSFMDDYLLLGLLYFSGSQYEKAIETLREGHRLWPDDVQFISNLGVLYNRINKIDDALHWLKLAIEKNPNDANTHDSICHVYAKIGRFDLARKHGDHSLTLKDQLSAEFPAISLAGKPIPPFDIEKPERNIISYSLWGKHPRYLYNAQKNAEIAPHLYPGWRCRFYCEESSVPERVITRLIESGCDVVLMPDQRYRYEGLFWRFFVANDPSVDRFLIRDVDSIINVKECYAVNEWVNSNKHFHTLHDYYTHTDPILAGMWGGVAGVLPQIKEEMEPYLTLYNKTANSDQLYLREKIWPIIRQSVLNHDSFFTANQAVPYPKEAQLPKIFHVGQDHFNLGLASFRPGGRFTPSERMNKRKKAIFTLTSGRSGTVFLYQMLKKNLKDVEAYHERIFLGEFDSQTPNLEILRLFNSEGNVHDVRCFWRRKCASFLEGKESTYVEASHLLAKAGLIENLDLLRQHKVETHIICLRRNYEKIAWSYYNRFDFYNSAFTWQWTLDPIYARNIVPYSLFSQGSCPDMMRKCLWYTYEIHARMEYYKLLYAQTPLLRFHDVNLEDIVKEDGAKSLINSLGETCEDIEIPPPANTTPNFIFPETDRLLLHKLNSTVNNIDLRSLAKEYLEQGKRFG